jgi:uncharacterized protein (DUF427 family)
MARAVWNGQVIAETGGGMLVETNVYFPPDAVRTEFLRPTDRSRICQWKGGMAPNFEVEVAGKVAQSFRGWPAPQRT